MSKTSKKIKGSGSKSIEEKYQKKNLHEHILHSPDTYIGSIEDKTCNMWVFNKDSKDNEAKIIFKEISYVPGFYKICDEVIVNAADHNKRCPTCTIIKITIDQESGRITVWNNGDGVDIVEHKEHKIMVPSMIFGDLLTSTNYDKGEEKTVGGKNGFGAKLANIYSVEFILETIDETRNLKFYQKFTDNMYNKEKAKIKSAGGKKPYTRISFVPDFKKFGLEGITDDMMALLQKKAYDLAMTSTAKVYFNDKLISQNNFIKYIDLYFPEGSEHKKVIDVTTHERWKVCAVYDPTDQLEHQNISFVNGICTSRGGTHVEQVTNQVVNKLKDAVQKKVKGLQIKPTMIKENLLFFVDSTIVNPDFDTQTKECLTTKTNNFGSNFTVTDVFIKKIIKTGVVDQIVANAQAKAEASLSKTDGKGKGPVRYEKLYNAHKATTKDGYKCTLILTEGDSAKTFAMSGLNVVGRDYYGVFPLKGKVLNVRDESPVKIANNEEITAIKKIIGLEQGKVYDDLKGLRYGSIMILTDQDSVTADTPLLLRNHKNQIKIKTIDDISSDWTMHPNGKEYSTTNRQIWTDNGWTNITHVIRHKVMKKIYRILTHTGAVDVTEDHSLLKIDGEKISPKECTIGSELLHSFPSFKDNATNIIFDPNNVTVRELWKYASQLKIQHYQGIPKEELIDQISDRLSVYELKLDQETEITPEEAFVMGFFWADGTCGVYEWKYRYKNKDRPQSYVHNRVSYCWSITNTNMDFLIKSKEIMEKHYDYEFNIIECDISKNEFSKQRCYRLIINGGKKTETIVTKYRKLFYDKNKKKAVPYQILNAPYEVRKSFFDGYYDGDGCKYHLDTTGSRYFEIDGKIGAHGMYFLCKSIGYEVSVNHNIKKPKIYCLTLTKGHQQNNPNIIKKIFCIGKTEQYVYDLETENHHFQAGIGQMIVHNTDGSHIKGLIMNFIHHFWPSLAKYEGFIKSFATPLLKASKGKGPKREVIAFTSMQEFEEWNKENNNAKGWNIKYYKGLGTSKPEEAQECFEDLDDKLISYYWQEKMDDKSSIGKKEKKEIKEIKEIKEKKTINSEFIDEESDLVSETYKPKNKDVSEDAITLAFAKKREDDRKLWLNSYDSHNYIDAKEKRISYYDFIHKELIAFSVYDTARSIPNLLDGLKPGQRKVYYGSVKKNIYNNEIKVAQLTGYIGENAHYHHGETSLGDTIVKMAQNYVGSNNINLLLPNGQFGSRLCGGKDASSTRYIFTQLNALGKKIFIEDDFEILEQQHEDGDLIEPTFYAPIIPMILANGTEGIGTGYSTSIEPCNPRDIYANIRRILEGEKPKAMKPWYRHFTGTIEKLDNNKYLSRAKYDVVDDNTIHITDLPIGIWTDNYKAFLDNLINQGADDKKAAKKDEKTEKTGKTEKTVKGKKKGGSKASKFLAKKSKKSKTAKVAKANPIASAIKTYTEDCTEIRISFTITFHPGKLQNLIKKGQLDKGLKLVTPLNLTNMHLFDENGKIRKYESYGAILKSFAKVRLELYQKRKDYLLDKWRKEIDMLKWKLKFVEGVIADKIIVFKKKSSEIIEQLEEQKFPKFIVGEKKNPSYDYLTSMTILKFSKDEIEKLRKQIEDKKDEAAVLEGKTPAMLWTEELDDFIEAYGKWEAEVDAEYDRLMLKKKGSKNTKKAPKKKVEANE